MKTSQKGLTLVESEEGLRLQTYLDTVGRATIGYGHLILSGESYTNGITQAEAQSILAIDIEKVENALNALELNLNQNQFDALIDFGFNLGTGALKQLLGHGLAQLPTQIVRWDHAGANVSGPLLKRRQTELALFQTPVTSD